MDEMIGIGINSMNAHNLIMTVCKCIGKNSSNDTRSDTDSGSVDISALLRYSCTSGVMAFFMRFRQNSMSVDSPSKVSIWTGTWTRDYIPIR